MSDQQCHHIFIDFGAGQVEVDMQHPRVREVQLHVNIGVDPLVGISRYQFLPGFFPIQCLFLSVGDQFGQVETWFAEQSPQDFHRRGVGIDHIALFIEQKNQLTAVFQHCFISARPFQH